MKTSIQAKVFDFALSELVIEKRNSFQPLWTVNSWAKFLIWVAVNCGVSGERESLEVFADALGGHLTARMRRLFFERTLDHRLLHLMADPAEKNVLVMALPGCESIAFDQVKEALHEVGLIQINLLDTNRWQLHDGLISIPWKSSEKDD